MRPMDGKTTLVTGASSGIGRAIAQRFADDGARVYLTGRRKDELEAAAEAIGPDAVAVPCDVSQAADLDRVMDVIRGDGRQLDVVVANAGLGDGSLLQDVTEEHRGMDLQGGSHDAQRLQRNVLRSSLDPSVE